MKYPMNHRSLTSKSLMPATPSAMNEDVVQMFQITHETTIAMTRSKFPDLSLTFHNIFNFPWPITKFPDNSLTFAWYGISWLFPDRWTPWAWLTTGIMVVVTIGVKPAHQCFGVKPDHFLSGRGQRISTCVTTTETTNRISNYFCFRITSILEYAVTQFKVSKYIAADNPTSCAKRSKYFFLTIS